MAWCTPHCWPGVWDGCDGGEGAVARLEQGSRQGAKGYYRAGRGFPCHGPFDRLSDPLGSAEAGPLPSFLGRTIFFKKKLARVKAVRIMRDLGGGTLPAKDLPERQVC
jgi:hypothetical protein